MVEVVDVAGDDTSSARAVPAYVVAMVRRLPPAGTPVIPESTPVVAFGDPARAEVATLGINPSAAEFLAGGTLLAGDQRRLATLPSLGAEQLDLLSDRQVVTVVADCVAYFHRLPYRRWFDPLDRLLRGATGTSYYDGSACHLDLVQWATNPTWSAISEVEVQRALLEDGLPHLRAQLARENVRLVLLNGRRVLKQVTDTRLASLTQIGDIAFGKNRCRLFAGAGEGVRWVGWSTNLQSSRGVTTALKDALGRWISDVAAPGPATESGQIRAGIPLDEGGHVPRGTWIEGKRELVAVLNDWLGRSRAPTVGDVGTFGGRPWLRVRIGTVEVALNADTKRAAVEQFVRDSRTDPGQGWRVVANLRGRVNKVLPSPDGDPLPGWYAYLTEPLAAPGSI